MAKPGQLQMYNKLETWDLFQLTDKSKDKNGVKKKVHYHPDGKINNCGTYSIWLEDHTLGNCLRMSLFRDENVLFAGYKVPHPLQNLIELRIQTTQESDPETVLANACVDLKEEWADLKGQWAKEMEKWKAVSEAARYKEQLDAWKTKQESGDVVGTGDPASSSYLGLPDDADDYDPDSEGEGGGEGSDPGGPVDMEVDSPGRDAQEEQQAMDDVQAQLARLETQDGGSGSDLSPPSSPGM